MVVLDGDRLAIEQVIAVAVHHDTAALAPESIEKMLRSRSVVERLAAGEEPVYGVNTGVGLLADVRVPPADLEQLQRNVVRSHAAGIGDPLAREEVRAMMLIRANVLAKGFSGIRPVVAERLCQMLEHGVTPVVPSQGSVGASGDLAPLAHMALVLMGEGEAEFAGARMPGREALRLAGIEPLALASKEGISLLNGTQAMLAIGCLELAAAEVLIDTAEVVSCRRVQDAYSLRCAPQVHGAVRDTLAEARRVFSIELNSATDNPLVFESEVLSGGNFHGEPLALQLDYLAIALTALSGISERRIDRLVNPALNEDLPPFLAQHAGLESGLMMAQVTAAALVAENRVLATPASPGSITTSGNKEDFVSMGMTSALKWQRVVRNTRAVLSIEALAAVRALEFLRPLKTSPVLEVARARIQSVCTAIEGDRPISPDIAALDSLIHIGQLTVGSVFPR